jgi:outer membrane protein OmpA-like peptidoglycan-associated protein
MVTIPTRPAPWDSGRQAVPVSEELARKRAETDAFVSSAQSLGSHVQWWEVAAGVRLKLLDFVPRSPVPRLDHKQALDDAAAFLLVSPHRRVWIIGHAEAKEGSTDAEWQSLSERRARQVWTELSRRKIARTQVLDIAGHGVMGAGASLSLEVLSSADYSPAS